ncbi:hypothetical protein KAR91_17730 [Candidatus Pacearchaeota archaeon]|nr:hypothetical protein [Candidatus Pacearchaeota archaeon]
MKKNTILCVLVVLVVSCSISLVDVEKSKVDYVKSGIVCDSKTTKFEILNKNELAGFLDNDNVGSFDVKYQYGKTKKTKLKRVLRVTKITIKDNGEHYKMKYERFTFPMSKCRRLKTDVRVFE